MTSLTKKFLNILFQNYIISGFIKKKNTKQKPTPQKKLNMFVLLPHLEKVQSA